MKLFFCIFLLINATFLTSLSDSKNEFKLKIPADWVAIPQLEIRKYQERTYNATGHRLNYHSAYQLKSNKAWFEIPFVVITVDRKGKLIDSELKKYRNLQNSFNSEVEKAKEIAGDLISDASIEEPTYDSKTHTIWSTVKISARATGDIQGLSASRLTNYGFVQFNGYSLAIEYRKYSDVFLNIANSISIKESDKFIPATPPSATLHILMMLSQFLVVGVPSGIILGFYFFFQSRKNKRIEENRKLRKERRANRPKKENKT